MQRFHVYDQLTTTQDVTLYIQFAFFTEFFVFVLKSSLKRVYNLLGAPVLRSVPVAPAILPFNANAEFP